MLRAASVVAVALVLTGCASAGPHSADPDASSCASTEISVVPETVVAGGTITVTGEASGCDPGRDYDLTMTTGQYEHPIPITAPSDYDGWFQAEVTVPSDYPAGPATIVLDAPYPPCNDTGGAYLIRPFASCAAVQVLFTVEAAQ
jgi:hypothetical protein